MGHARFRPLAVQDLRQTSAWLNEQAGPNVTARFLDAVRASVELLASMPSMGSPCGYSRPELKELRRWPVKDFDRWLIFYLPYEDGIDVARVLHGARNLDEIFD